MACPHFNLASHQFQLTKPGSWVLQCVQSTLCASSRYAITPTTEFGFKDAMAAWPANPLIPVTLPLALAATGVI
jgi:hypothetical protein